MDKPRVLLADDHALLLDALAKLLADDCEVVGTVTDGHALLEAAERLRPDIAIVDIAMPVLNGIDATRRLKQLVPETQVIFLTMSEDTDVAAAAFRAGGSGFLLKRSAAFELRTAIQEVSRHRAYVTPLMTQGLVGALMRAGHLPQDEQLTPRQSEIVQLIAEGRSMKEIAAVLSISARTVAFHKYRVMEQLHMSTTAELIQYAVKRHIV